MNSTNTGDVDEHERPADKAFFVLFYFCIGFLSTFVGMFGRHAFLIPFITVVAFVCLRFAMRAPCRNAMLMQLRSRQGIALIALVGCVLVYALVGISADFDRMRLIGKPLIIAIGTMLLAFGWAYRDALDQNRIVTGMFWGIFGGLLGVVLVSLWNFTTLRVYSTGGPLPEIPISTLSLNDELKILSVLIFFAAAGLANRKRFLFASIGVSLLIWMISFYTFGVYEYADRTFLRHVSSDIVQFGIPVVIVIFLLSLLAPGAMTNLVFSGIGFLLLFTPWIFQLWYVVASNVELPRASKFLVRAEIWDKVSQLSLEKPLFGHGLDAARYIGEIKFENTYFKGNEIAHPHNMFVQIWMDMGLLGAAIGLIFCYFSWKAVRSIPLSTRPAIIAGICMYILFAMVTHSLWQTWSIALLMLIYFYTTQYVRLR